MKYAVRETGPGRRCGYSIVDPATGDFASHEAVPSGYCVMPSEFPLAEAQALAQQLTARVLGSPVGPFNAEDPQAHLPAVWGVEIAPGPCARCSRKIFANDMDFCYPSTRERTQFRAGCNEHDFGCGHKVVAFPSKMSWRGGTL